MANLFGALGKSLEDWAYNTFYSDTQKKNDAAVKASNQQAQAHAQMKAGQINPVQYKRQAAIAANSIAPAYSAPAPQQQGYAPQAPSRPQIQAPRISDIPRPQLNPTQQFDKIIQPKPTIKPPVPQNNSSVGFLGGVAHDMFYGSQKRDLEKSQNATNMQAEAHKAYKEGKISKQQYGSILRQAADSANNTTARSRIAPELKKGLSYKDIAQNSGYSTEEVKDYVKKYNPSYGDRGLAMNALGGVKDFGVNMLNAGAGIVTKPIHEATANRAADNDKLKQINADFKAGNITGAAAMERAQAIADPYINKKVNVSDDGTIGVGSGNALDFLGKFTMQGVDTASVLPVGGAFAKGAGVGLQQVGKSVAGPTLSTALTRTGNMANAVGNNLIQTTINQTSSKIAEQLATRGMNIDKARIIGNALTNNAKEAGIYGTLQTGSDIAQGNFTLEGALMNYGGQFALGVVGELGLSTAGTALGKGIRTAPTPERVVKEHPEIQGLETTAKQYFDHRNSLIDRGLSPNSTAVRAVDNAIRKLGKEYDKTYKRLYEMQTSGGSVPAGMFDPTGGKLGKQPDVPKEDLIIRNDGGKAMSIEKDPLEALKQEALKYKSADEFVKAQGEPVYHGTGSKFDKFDSQFQGQNYRQGEGGFHFTSKKSTAENYATLGAQSQGKASGHVIEAHLKLNKPLTVEAPSSIRAADFYDDHIGDIQLQAMQNGNDGIIVKGNGENLHIALSPDVIHTKQQLTDLYNQAHTEAKTPAPQAPKAEAPKPTLQDALEGKSTKIKSEPKELSPTANSYAHEYTPDEIIKDTVDYWYKHGKDTKGGQMIDTTGELDAYGSGIKRISEHNQFYSDFYKAMKRAPTKADYEKAIRTQLEKGGGNMVEPDMATAYQLAKARKAETDALANVQDTTDYSMVFDAQKDGGLSVKQSNTPVQVRSKSGQKLRNSQETLSRSSQQSGQKTPSPDSKARTGQTYTDNTPQAPYSKESLNRIERALNPNDKFAYKNLTPVEKKLYQGEKAKQRLAKLEAKEQARIEKAAQLQKRQDTINNSPDIDTESYLKDMSKAQKDAAKGDSGISAKASDFKEKFIDDLSPIEDRLNKAIKNGTSIDPKDHITYQLDRSRRSEGITHAYIRDNGLDKIIQNVDNTKEFDQYLIARHAKELDPEITTGRDLAKDAALVRQLDGKYGEAAKKLYAYNQKLLDTSVDYGLISKEMATKLKKQYPEYVPFNRIFNEDELANLYGGAGKGNASISKQSAIQKIKGSKRAIASPLNSIIDKTRVVIEQGERNKAAEMLANYRKLAGNPFNLKEIPSTETIGSRSTISFLDKGKKRVFETDKEIADAAKNMTRQDIGLWGRIAAIPARVLRGGATSANVGFAGANVVKDIIGAAINSRHPFYITDPDAFGKALAAALNHKGKYYQELMREGVAGTSFDMYRNPNKSSVGEVRSHKNLATRTAYNVTHPSQWYRTFEDTIGRSEDFGRALQYYSNKKGFEDKLGVGNKNATILAADQARSNSTNFFRHGSYGKGINLAIPYWNAGVQGARIGVNRIKDRPVQTLTKIGFVIAAPSAMIAMNNYGNDKNRQVMEDIPQYEKDGNIIIVGPDARKNEKTGKWEGVTKIPVPPQHIGIHKTIQDAVRASMTGEAFDLVGNLGRITEDYTTVNPTDVKAVASKYTPQGLKLVAEPLSNTNFFTGNKIVPDSQKNLPAADQYNDYTSGTAKTLGKLTNISPRQIDNAIRTGMGGAGQNLVYGVDNALAATGVIDKKDVKGENPINSITRRFSGAASISPSEKADKEFSKYRQEVMNSEEYKNASQYDKSRMLNRLQSDLEAVAYDKSGKSESKLSSKQQSLKDNGFDKSIYTNLDSKVKNTKDTGWTDEYNAAKSAYDKESSSWNPVEKEKKGKELRTLDVKRHYSKEATSLYDMNEKDIYGFLDRQDEKKAQSYYKQIVEYGDKMVEAGLWSTNKLRDKYGNLQYERGYVAANGKLAKGGSKSSGRATGGRKASTGRKPSGGSGGRSGGDVTSGKALLALQTGLNKIKTPRTTGKTPMPKSSVPVPPSFNKKNLRKFAVKSATLTAKKARA